MIKARDVLEQLWGVVSVDAVRSTWLNRANNSHDKRQKMTHIKKLKKVSVNISLTVVEVIYHAYLNEEIHGFTVLFSLRKLHVFC